MLKRLTIVWIQVRKPFGQVRFSTMYICPDRHVLVDKSKHARIQKWNLHTVIMRIKKNWLWKKLLCVVAHNEKSFIMCSSTQNFAYFQIIVCILMRKFLFILVIISGSLASKERINLCYLSVFHSYNCLLGLTCNNSFHWWHRSDSLKPPPNLIFYVCSNLFRTGFNMNKFFSFSSWLLSVGLVWYGGIAYYQKYRTAFKTGQK